MQYWQSPLILVMVSLIAAIQTQQAPDAHQMEPIAKPSSSAEQSDVQLSLAAPDTHAPDVRAPLAGLLARPRMAKRSWNKMQGVWGKRRALDEPEDDDQHQHEAKRGWSSLTQQGWGKRSWNQMYGAWGKRANNWNKMQGVWGKRSPVELDDDETDEDVAKRSNWNKMQGVWGKRSAEEDDGSYLPADEEVDPEKRAWNQLHGAWGKRSPADRLDEEGDDDDWNTIRDEPDSWTRQDKRGLSPLAAGYKRNWSNLRGSWGKREMPLAYITGKGNEWSRKRESGWNNLKGLWG